MHFLRLTLLIALVCFMPEKGWSGLLIESGFAFENSSYQFAEKGQIARTGFAGGIYFQASKKWWIGWNVFSSQFETSMESNKSSYSSMDMGPSFKYEFGSDQVYFLKGTYHLNIESTVKIGTSTEKIQGSSYVVGFGVQPQIYDGVRLGVSLNYYSGSHSKKVVSSVQSTVSYSNSWIYPSINLGFQF